MDDSYYEDDYDDCGYDDLDDWILYDGFPCPEASDLEEAEMIYWNTH